MFERFTERARRVVVLAQEEARAFQHNYIGTEHILLGLALHVDGVSGKALQNCGITIEELRERMLSVIGRGTTPSLGHQPFTPRTKKVFELAQRSALGLNHNYIGTEHVLLGLLREGEGVGASILRQVISAQDRPEETDALELVKNEVYSLLQTSPHLSVTLSLHLDSMAEFVKWFKAEILPTAPLDHPALPHFKEVEAYLGSSDT
jgi:ATP-dependent Clp protease ATP-binding subunit ClpA